MSKRLKVLVGIATALLLAGAAFLAALSEQERAFLSRSDKKTVERDYLARITEKANAGEPLAMFSLSLAYENGTIVPQDYKVAFDWLEKAANLNYPAAQNNLAGAYLYGRGTKKNVDKAVFWYEKAAAQNLPAAQLNLGRLYFMGTDVEKDEQKAHALLLQAALSGNSEAANILGIMYFRGRGVPENKSLGLKWYMKAAEGGNAYAQFNLGEMYRKGDGVERDDEAAVEFYRQAVNSNHREAMIELASMYNDETRPLTDLIVAGELYRRAADDGDTPSKEYLDSHIGICNDGWKLSEEQVRSCLLAGGGGDAQGQFVVGLLYYGGRKGLEKNDTQAVQWFRRSAEQGSLSAQAMLGEMYFRGFGVEKDAIEGFAWASAASQRTPSTEWERTIAHQTSLLMKDREGQLTDEEKRQGLERAAKYIERYDR